MSGCVAIGTVGAYFLRGDYAVPFLAFYLMGIITAVIGYGRRGGIVAALVSFFLYFPAVLVYQPTVIEDSIGLYPFFLFAVLVAFAELANLLVQRAAKANRQVTQLAASQANVIRMLEEKQLKWQILYQATKEIRAALHIEDVVDKVIDAMLKVVHAHSCSLWLVDEQRGRLVCVGAAGVDAGSWQGLSMAVGEGLSGWVAAKRQALRSEDLSKDPRWKNPLKRKADFRCALSVPMLIGDRTVGAVTALDRVDQQVFTEDDERMLQHLADHIAVAIENARLFKELQRKLDDVSTLLDVAKSLISVVDLEKLFQVVIDSAVQVLRADAGYLLVYDEEKDELLPRAFSRILPGFAESLVFKSGEGISGRVLETGEPVLVTGVDDLLRLRFREIHWEEIASAVWVPLMYKGQAIGVMCCYTKREGRMFTREDQELLSTLAGQAALAIEKSRLYEDLVNTNIRAVRALSVAIDASEPYVAKKLQKAVVLTKKLCDELKLDNSERELLEYAAQLYDIGKIGLPDAILQKPGPLLEEERKLVEQHVHIGANILSPVEFLRDAVPYIFLHHERFDGRGYPLGLKGDEIPLGARVLSVIDAYLAMTQDRPYRQALDKEQAVAELKRQAGSQFDPAIVTALVKVLSREDKDLSEPVAAQP